MIANKKLGGSTLAPQWMPNVAVAVSALVVTPVIAQGTEEVATLEAISAQTTSIKQDYASTNKFTRPLVDTPQSIQVIPSEVLKEQNAQTLEQVLRNVPGVTFSSGEGGAGWGDMFTIRGMQAEQAVTVDEVRDSALTTRTDTFNLENVDVYKGTGSFETGVGSFGGGVNLVSKAPHLGDANELSLGVGTDDYRRATLDMNRQLSDTVAIRLNAMGHKNGVAGRGPTEMERWGIAPSISFGLGTPTRATLSYFYQKDENIPDFGLPVSTLTGKRMDGVGWDFWGGYKNFDTEETKTQRLSLKVEHDFSEQARFKNITSWGKTQRFTSFASGGRQLNAKGATKPGYQAGNFNNSDYWGYSGRRSDSFREDYPTGFLSAARLPNNTNRYEGKILSNQSTLNLDFNTGSLKHSLVLGLDLYEESYRRKPYSVAVPDSSAGREVIDVRSPSEYWGGPVRTNSSTNKSGAEVQNIGVFAYDSIKLNEQWEVAGGLRFDHYRGKWFDEDGSKLPQRYKDNLWSGRLGIVYKPVENGSIYLSYSQAKQPSIAAMASRSGGGSGNSEYSPGKASTWELGTKWDLFDNNLALTAAIFQTEKSNPTDVDAETLQTTQYAGKDRVRGIELTASGNLTERWSAYAGFSYMHGKIIEDQENPLQVGGRLKNVPKYTFNLWTTYSPTEDLDLSLGAQYIGKRQFGRGNVSEGANYGGHDITKQAPSYWVANAAVTYRVNKNVDIRLNVNNIFDKKYLSRLTTSSDGFQRYGVPGEGRTFILSSDIRF